MIYQGEQVNFSQVSDQQFTALIQAVGQTNSQVALNSRNLVKMGTDMTKMGKDNTYFGNKVTEIDGRLSTNEANLIVMGGDLTKIGKDNTNLGNGITRIDNAIKGILQSLGTTNNAVQTNSTNLVSLGNSMQEHSDSPHNQGGSNPFGFLTGLSTAALAAGGLGAYLLLKGKK
tara:strand:- start:560 stop:1078 length:519 start_codon:yes stop_codon:yes gene_type:complete